MALTYSQMLPLGTQLPEFQLLNVVDNQLFDSKNEIVKQGVIVMVICNHCPYVIHYHNELKKLVTDYNQSLNFIAISSNNIKTHPQDSPDRMYDLFKELKFNFPYLYDETQEVAKLLKAECTPEFYLYDTNSALVYRGRLDDASPGNPIEPTGKDLRGALNSLLSGESIIDYQQPSMGCSIKWKKSSFLP